MPSPADVNGPCGATPWNKASCGGASSGAAARYAAAHVHSTEPALQRPSAAQLQHRQHQHHHLVPPPAPAAVPVALVTTPVPAPAVTPAASALPIAAASVAAPACAPASVLILVLASALVPAPALGPAGVALATGGRQAEEAPAPRELASVQDAQALEGGRHLQAKRITCCESACEHSGMVVCKATVLHCSALLYK